MSFLAKLAEFKAVIAAAVLVVGVTSGVVAWTADIQTRVAVNTDYRLLQTYKTLLARYMAERRLSTEDQIEFCNAARELKIGGPIVKELCG